MHYSTERIMNAVYNNHIGADLYNDDIQIIFGTALGQQIPPWQREPYSMEAFQVTVPTTDIVLSFFEYLDAIFEDGAELIIETTILAGDDGGPCYQAYILDVDWVQHYNEYMDQQADALLHDSIFSYITTNNEAFMMVWAGPY